MKSLRSALLLAGIVTLSSVVPASASTTLTWQHAKKALLPGGATGLPSGYLPTLACSSVGNCESGGSYSLANGVTNAMVLREVKRRWTTPTTLRAPVGVHSNANMQIFGLSCGSVGNCSAAGSYSVNATNTLAFVDDQVNGRWLSANEVTLPVDALTNGQSALVHSVVCPSPGNCSGVGTYLDNDPVSARSLGFVVNEVHGVWRSADEVTYSASTNANPFTALNQLACSSVGNCVGVGSFIDVHDVTQALLVVERNGQWSSGVTIAPPPNASEYAGVSVSEVTCVKKSSCAIVGTYYTNTGAIEGFSASATNGHWSNSVELAMPANAAVNPHVFLYGYQGIACSSAANCALGGQYLDNNGNYQGFLENDVAGSWKRAVEVVMPVGGGSAGKNGGVVAISCPSKGNCRAGAAYLDIQGIYQALLIVETSGVWHQGTKVVLPAGATTVGIDGGIYSLVCVTTNSCTAIGSYLEPTTFYQGLTLSS